MKTNKKIRTIYYFWVIPVSLLVLWVISTLFFIKNSELGFLTLDQKYNAKIFSNFSEGQRIRETSLRGSINARYPNLSKVGFRLNTQNSKSNNRIEIILSETSGQIIGKQTFYAFSINNQSLVWVDVGKKINSDGQTYNFELRAIDGTLDDSIVIHNSYPNAISQYSFNIKEMFSSRKNLEYFYKNKVENLKDVKGLSINFLIFSIPFFIYYLIIAFKNDYQTASVVLLLISLLDIISVNNTHDFLYPAVFFGWIVLMKKNCISQKITTRISAFIFTLLIASSSLGVLLLSNKLSIWLYVFLGISIILQLSSDEKMEDNVQPKQFFYEVSRFFSIAPLLLDRLISGKPQLILKPVDKERLPIIYRTIHRMLLDNNHKLNKYFIIPSFVILFIVLLISPIHSLLNTRTVYESFYQQDHLHPYLIYTLLPSSLLYLLAVTGTIILVRRIRLYFIPILLALLLLSRGQDIVIDLTTKFRDDVKILNLTPRSTDEAWVDVVIEGRNFLELPNLGIVKIDDVEQRTIDWTDKRIIFRTDPYTTKTGKVTIVRKDGKLSNDKDFNYTKQIR